MKTKYPLLILVTYYLLHAGHVTGQNLPYLFSSEIKDTSFTENSRVIHGYPVQLLYSYNGNYRAALNTLWPHDGRPGSAEGPGSYAAVDAKSYILAQASRYQIIIINEDHHNSSHRLFTTSLLKDLRALGFTNFSVEGLKSYRGDSLNIRKFPLLADLDYYDPQFANMIREGLKYNFRVTGHDTANFSLRGNRDPFLFDRTRDTLGARNIQDILRKNPVARIIIHCGQSHGYRCIFDPKLGKRFAMLVRELTGIDPLVINQDHYQEKQLRDDTKLSSPQKTATMAMITFPGGKLAADCEDIALMHPPTSFVNNRPDWLKTPETKYFFPADYLDDQETMLALAYKIKEPLLTAVPVDVAEIDGRSSRTALILPPGKYHLVLMDKSRKQRVLTIKA